MFWVPVGSLFVWLIFLPSLENYEVEQKIDSFPTVMQIISLDLSFLDQKLVYEVSYTAFSTVIFARENNALSKVNAPEN